MKIDYEKLRAAIKQNTQTIRALKNQGRRWSAQEMKLEATRLHALAAHLHGRIHLSGKFLCNPRAMKLSDRFEPCYLKFGMTKEEQEKFITPLLVQFTKEEKGEAALPA